MKQVPAQLILPGMWRQQPGKVAVAASFVKTSSPVVRMYLRYRGETASAEPYWLQARALLSWGPYRTLWLGPLRKFIKLSLTDFSWTRGWQTKTATFFVLLKGRCSSRRANPWKIKGTIKQANTLGQKKEMRGYFMLHHTTRIKQFY